MTNSPDAAHWLDWRRQADIFNFYFGEAAGWLDRTVQVPTVNSLTLKQWMDEFQRLKKLNQEIVRVARRTSKKPRESAWRSPGTRKA